MTRSDPELVPLTDPDPEAAWQSFHASGMDDLISSYHLAQVLAVVARNGMGARILTGLPPDQVVAGLHPAIGPHLLTFLEVHGVIQVAGDLVAPTPRGRNLLSEVSLAQLAFYLDAYGPVTGQLDGLLSQEWEYGVDVQRDGGALGESCATLFHAFHTATVLKVMEGMGVNSILDLGCGAGQFLIDAARQHSGLQGVGLDIAADAISLAQQAAIRAGVDDRIKFVVGDAFRPETWPQACVEVDALCAHGVLHEHFRDGEEAVLRILETYADLMGGRMRGFILGEPEIRYDLKDNDPDLYLVHALTKQGFPRRRKEWLELIARSCMRCRRVFYRPSAGPRFNFFDLVPR